MYALSKTGIPVLLKISLYLKFNLSNSISAEFFGCLIVTPVNSVITVDGISTPKIFAPSLFNGLAMYLVPSSDNIAWVTDVLSGN